MANSLSVLCPGCGTKLKVTPKTIGKLIACPLCQERFVVNIPREKSAAAIGPKAAKPRPEMPPDRKAAPQQRFKQPASSVSRPASQPAKSARPAVDDAEAAAYADFDALEDDLEIIEDFDEEDFGSTKRTAGRSRKPTVASRGESLPGRRLPEKQKKNVKLGPADTAGISRKLLIGGSIIVGLVLFAGFVMLAISTFQKVSQKAEQLQARFDLSWLPKYPLTLVSFRVADAWNSPFGQEIAAEPEVKQNISEMRENLGIGPEDIEQIVYCNGPAPEMMGHGLTAAMQVAKSAGSLGTGGSFEHTIIIVRALKPFDTTKIAKVFGSKGRIQYNDTEYTNFTSGGMFSRVETSSAYMPDEKTLILGATSSVRHVIDLAGADPECPELAALDGRHHLVVAMLPRNLPSPPSVDFMDPNAPTPPLSPTELLKKEMKLMAASLNFTDGIQFRFTAEAHTAETAEAIHKTLSAAQGEFGAPVQLGLVGLPFHPPGSGQVEEALTKKKSISLNGKMIEAESSLSADELKDAKKSFARTIAMLAIGEFDQIGEESGEEMLADIANEGDPDGNVLAKNDGREGAEMEDSVEAEMAADVEPADSGKALLDGEKTINKSSDKAGKAVPPKDPKAVIDALEARGCLVAPLTPTTYKVDVRSEYFGNNDMTVLAALKGVTIIDIQKSKVSDRGILALQKAGSTLEELTLGGSDLTNSGIKYFDPEKFTALRLLNLRGNMKLNDECLVHLEKLGAAGTLQALILRETSTTLKGVEDLRTKIPAKIIK